MSPPASPEYLSLCFFEAQSNRPGVTPLEMDSAHGKSKREPDTAPATNGVNLFYPAPGLSPFQIALLCLTSGYEKIKRIKFFENGAFFS